MLARVFLNAELVYDFMLLFSFVAGNLNIAGSIKKIEKNDS